MLNEELSAIDYQIIEFVKNNDLATIEDIKKAFPNIAAVEMRVEILSKTHKTVSHGLITSTMNCLKENCIVSTDEYGCRIYTSLNTYSITPIGEKTLQDYHSSKKQHKKEVWLKNAWIPILVTIATSFVIDGIKWLLPQIPQWLSNIL